MKPIKQTTFYGGGKHYGNCMQAAVASILDLEIEDVPHLLLFDDLWEDALILFMASRGCVYHGRSDGMPTSSGVNGYFLVVGTSPRGVAHMVIYKNNEMAHDPHPENNGVVPNIFYDFEKNKDE